MLIPPIFSHNKSGLTFQQTTYLTDYLIFHLLHKPKIIFYCLDLMRQVYISIHSYIRNCEGEENSNNTNQHPYIQPLPY